MFILLFSALVCSIHFDDKQYSDGAAGRKTRPLVDTAVPTLFLPARGAADVRKIDTYFTSSRIESNGDESPAAGSLDDSEEELESNTADAEHMPEYARQLLKASFVDGLKLKKRMANLEEEMGECKQSLKALLDNMARLGKGPEFRNGLGNIFAESQVRKLLDNDIVLFVHPSWVVYLIEI